MLRGCCFQRAHEELHKLYGEGKLEELELELELEHFFSRNVWYPR
jgi:hypothetical protein